MFNKNYKVKVQNVLRKLLDEDLPMNINGIRPVKDEGTNKLPYYNPFWQKLQVPNEFN